MISLQTSPVQRKMADKFSSWLFKNHQIHVEVEKLKPGIIGDFYFEDLYLPGNQLDTLLFVDELKIQTSFFRWNHLSSVYFEGLFLAFHYENTPDDSEWFETFQGLYSKSSEVPFLIDHTWINGGQIELAKGSDVRSFQNLDLYLKESKFSSVIELVLSNLDWEFSDSTRHQVEASSLFFSDTLNSIKGFNWVSKDSYASVDLEEHKSNDSLILNVREFNATHDAVNGFTELWPESFQCGLNTTIFLKDDSLWTKSFSAYSDKGSLLDGSFGINNWKDPDAWNYSLDIDTLFLNKGEWDWLNTLTSSKYEFSSLGTIKSDFTLQGSLSELKLNASIDSDEGSLDAALEINMKDSQGIPAYRGNLNLNQFNLANLFPKYKVRHVDADIEVKGKGFDISSFDTDIHGDLYKIEIRDYTYQNIELDGRLQPDYFKGKAKIFDPHLELDFSGEIDFSGERPIMDFIADITEADLVQLKWYDKEPVAKLTSLIEMNLMGSNWTDIEGSLGAYFSTIQTSDNYYYFDDIYFQSQKLDDKDVLTLKSDFIHAKIEGIIDVPNVLSSVSTHLHKHFPMIDVGVKTTQNFDYEIQVHNSASITEIFFPELNVSDSTLLFGRFNNLDGDLVLNFESPSIQYGHWFVENLELQSLFSGDTSHFSLFGNRLNYNRQSKLQNFNLNQNGELENWRYEVSWEGSDSLSFDGYLSGETQMRRNSFDLRLDESQFYFADTLWTLKNNSTYSFGHQGYSTEIFLNTVSQELAFKYQNFGEDSNLDVDVRDFELNNFSPFYAHIRSSFDGKLTGSFASLKKGTLDVYTSAIQSDNLLVNGHNFGAVSLDLSYDEIEGIQNLFGAISKDSLKSMEFTGAYMPSAKNDNFNISLDVHDFNLAHVEDYISILDTLQGDVHGNISFFGQLNQPEFRGDLLVDDLRFSVPHMNIQFQSDSSSSIYLTDRLLSLNDIHFKGVENNSIIGLGKLEGDFNHRYFKDFNLDLNLKADSLLCLNTGSYVDKAYFGRAIATGDASFKGPTNAIDIEVNAASNKGTALFIPLDDEESIDELSFIHFIDKNQEIQDGDLTVTDRVVSDPTFTIDMNVELNEKAHVNIIFDETLGDKLRATGNGFINIGVDKANEVYMFGDYTIEEGDYLFTLQNFVNKKFEIEKGSKLTWDGSPSEAQMNLNALYKLNTNLSLLTSDTLYNKSRDVECRMMMTGDLLKPKIDFDIQIPNGDDRIRRILDEQTNTEEKNTQQFLSLLVLNTFMSSKEYNDTDVDYLSSTVSSGAEVLNNQFYNWTSQFSDRFDLGLKYHPNQGEYLSQRQWELLLNNMKVNDRITFNGNIATQAENTNRFIGDFEFEYQLSEDGKLRLSAFSNNLEENTQLQVEANKYYTTGLGLFYRDEFDDFRDLWKKFKGMFRKRNKR